jgi:hypothetical protein
MYTTEFSVTVICEDLFALMEELFDIIDISKYISKVDLGSFYDIETMIYTFEIDYKDVISTRNLLLSIITEEERDIMAMFSSGNWMNVIVGPKVKILATG